MELIPIPHEIVQKYCPLKKAEKFIKILRRKLKEKQNNKEDKILEHSCAELETYISKSKKFTLKEVETLIRDMQRSLIFLQNRKNKLQNKKRYKK